MNKLIVTPGIYNFFFFCKTLSEKIREKEKGRKAKGKECLLRKKIDRKRNKESELAEERNVVKVKYHQRKCKIQKQNTKSEKKIKK